MTDPAMHPVVQYLSTNPLASLEAIGVYARWSTSNPRKVSVNYDQYNCEDGHPLVNRCRGLVLRQDHDGERGAAGAYSVIAHPFDRFFNYGTQHAPDLDWSTAVFEEKLDGTLCIVYFDPDLDAWCVATRSVPDADVPDPNGVTFAEHFVRVSQGITPPDRSLTYCYELTGPGNQIVIPYDDWRVTLLAAFDRDGVERPEFRSAPAVAFENLEAARAWLAEQPGHLAEGFVVRDASGRRVKVMGTANTDAGLLAVLLGGNADDVAPLLPAERRSRLDELGRAYRAFVSGLESYADALWASDRKTAALTVQGSAYARWIGVVLDLWPHGSRRVTRFAEYLEVERKKTGGVLGATVVERILASLPMVSR